MKSWKWLTSGSLLGLLFTLAAAVVYTPTASAHGEKSQQAFLRMRTIHWYDTVWSKEQLRVNEEMEITGKFHTFSAWPEAVALPKVSFLNVGIPGPVLIRTESYIGGKFVPRSVELDIGKDYEYRIVLKARRGGEWHVHPMVNVEGGGPIIGPGKWVVIEGDLSEFKNPVTTLLGYTVDLERYNIGNSYFWHALWYALGVVFVAYFCRDPIFIRRLALVNAGKADEVFTAKDKRVVLIFAALTLLLVIFGWTTTENKYPITLPLQAGVIRNIPAMPEKPLPLQVKVDEATFRVAGREIRFVLTVTNNNDRPVQLCEFMTANIRFLNPDVCEDTTGYPEDLLAEEGLKVEPDATINPGETKTITAVASDAALEVYRLTDIVYDPESSIGGMFFFYDDAGNRFHVEVDAPLVPIF